MSDAPHKVIKSALDDLATYIDQEYPNRVAYPSEMRRYKRDIEDVTNARAALEKLRETVTCPDCGGMTLNDPLHECKTCNGTGRRVKP